jgi:hypothetical protein
MANEIKPPQVEPPIMVKPLRRNPLWRLLGWGGVACLALVAVVLTGQTEAGSRRLRLALDGSAEPAAVAALPRAGESSAETRRLVAQVHELTADRDRLNARIATLEHHLEDMTGSIKQQGEQIAAVRTVQPPPAVTQPEMTLAPPARTKPPALTPLPAPAGGDGELPWFMSMRTPQVPWRTRRPSRRRAKVNSPSISAAPPVSRRCVHCGQA